MLNKRHRTRSITLIVSLIVTLIFAVAIPAPIVSGASGGANPADNFQPPAAITAAGAFTDLSASYADLTQEEKAEILNRLGMLLGDPDRGLMLDIMVRRSDAAVFFTRLLGREEYVVARSETDFATSRFPDAEEGKWYTPYISFCTSIGIVAGRTDGYYYPDDNISEKEFANVLLKILGYEYEVDYNWDTVYEFAYDIGLFEDPAYATRKEDNREYYRRDVCDQVFAVLGLEKKNSPMLLIEELVETGAISEKAAADLGFDLSGLTYTAPVTGDDGYPEDADIYEIYHLEPDLLWVVFTKPVTFRDEAVEICQTYDYSKILSARVEEKSSRDALLRTGEQQPDMDYTIDISNVVETDGSNAGMLSFDFIGYNPSAPKDTPGGLTSLKRDVNSLPGAAGAAGAVPDQTNGDPDGAGTAGGAQESAEENNGAGNSSNTGGVIESSGNPGASAGSGTGLIETVAQPSGNADPSVDYFRITNAYTTASNELVVYFAHPVTETALNASYYNVVQGSTILSSGSAGQIRAELVENTNNAVRLIASGLTFIRGAQYRVTISGRLTSSYTARLNEGFEDSYTFTADNVSERSYSFILTSIGTVSQYGVELGFSQPLDVETAQQAYNYLVLDQNNRKIDITSVNVIPGAGSGSGAGGSGSVGGVGESGTVRISLAQPLLTQQNCTLTIIFTQNAAKTASIVNQSYQFQYGGQGETVKKSSLALTGAASYDPSCVELYFSQKLDPVSAEIASNYAVNGVFDGKNFTVSPVKASYDPVLTPYMVRLYFPSDRRFSKDHPYSIRIGVSIRDEQKLNPERTLEIQFYANNRDPVNPVLKDAVIVGEGIVRLDFSKEIMFDPAKIAEGNFSLIDLGGAATTAGAVPGAEPPQSPILAKYINTTTIILRFDAIDATHRYNVQFKSITDFSGQYTTNYPDSGSSIALRAGRK